MAEIETEYTNLLSLTIKSDKELINLWGTVYSGNHGKIVKYNDYFCEINPKGTLLIITNEDKPGVIGKIGTIMGENKINIASMHVARNVNDKTALTILNVDAPLEESISSLLLKVPEIVKHKIINL